MRWVKRLYRRWKIRCEHPDPLDKLNSKSPIRVYSDELDLELAFCANCNKLEFFYPIEGKKNRLYTLYKFFINIPHQIYTIEDCTNGQKTVIFDSCYHSYTITTNLPKIDDALELEIANIKTEIAIMESKNIKGGLK